MSRNNDQLYITSAYEGNINNVIKSDSEFLKSLNICKIPDVEYLYSITYGADDYSYADAERYYKHRILENGEESIIHTTGCSSLHKGIYCARNLDWTYNHEADFIIYTSASEDRHAVVGVAGVNPILTKQFVESGEFAEIYHYLPFQLLDGVNDAHLYCNLNITPAGDLGHTTSTNKGAKQVYMMTLVRYILDKCSTVDEAIDLVKSFDIYSSPLYETHIMVAQEDKTAVIEFVKNKVSIITDDETDEYLNFPDNATPVMTNFYLSKYVDENTIVAVDKDKIRAIEQTEITEEDTDLTPHAMGVERYKLLAENIDDVVSIDTAMETIKLARSTKSYKSDTNPFWYTEFTGETETEDYTIYLPQSAYEPMTTKLVNDFQYATREEDSPYFGFWQTTHSSVYDLENCTLTICSQEMLPEQYAEQYTFYLMNKI